MASPRSFLLSYALLLLLPFLHRTSAQRSTYIVHMSNSSKPTSHPTHRHWYSTLLQSLTTTTTTTLNSTTSKPDILYTYHHAIAGFAATLSPDELRSLQQSPGFISAYPDLEVKFHTTYTSRFLTLNDVTGLWPVSNYGEDIIIGVIDSGIWPESASFNDEGMTPVPRRWKGACELVDQFGSPLCNRKLIGARVFDRDKVSTTPGPNTPRDHFGHGTYTASIAAGARVRGANSFGYASGSAIGVAPCARVAAYKIALDGQFSAFASNVLAGFDAAIADGVDIITVSMGLVNLVPLYKDPFAIASFSAMKMGIPVMLSAGNGGPASYSLRNAFPWAVTVGASSIDRQFAGKLTVGGATFNGVSLFPASALLDSIPLVYNTSISGCNSSEFLSQGAAGKIVVCNNVGDHIADQMPLVTESDVAGAVFISESMFFRETGAFTCPSVVIDVDSGASLLSYMRSHGNNATATIEFQRTLLHRKPAPTIASYSSRGPAETNPHVLKPDLVAPGTRILGAWPPNQPAADIMGSMLMLSSNFTILSGTSASCPIVAGVAALLKAAHPDWSPAVIRSAMMTTAYTRDNLGRELRDDGMDFKRANSFAMGAGHVDPNKALDPGLVYNAEVSDYVRFLCATNFTNKQIMTITGAESYDCSAPSGDINYPSFIAFFGPKNSSVLLPPSVSFHRTVTNVGDWPAVYGVTVKEPVGFAVTVFPKKLVFKERYEKVSFRVFIQETKGRSKAKVSSGSLIWVHEEGKYAVKSPIVVVIE